jgi:magnesium transporter
VPDEVRNDQIELIRAFIERDDWGGAAALSSSLHASDIARLFAGFEDEKDVVQVFKLLTSELASEVLLEVDERLRDLLISSASAKELIDVVGEMETDDATDIISELPHEDARQVLEGIEREDSLHVQKLLAYPEDTAGGKMQAELVSVLDDATVQNTIEEVRRKSREIEGISNVFVVDSGNRLVGVIPLNRLILAEPDELIKDIAEKDPHKVATDLDQEEVAKIFQRYDLLSIPVVDHDNRLVGRITIDDVVDVIEEEIFEDFYRMAGVNKEERVMDPPRRSIWMRLPWLLVNVLTAFLAASVIKVFEGSIEKLVILAVLMPVVAGLGGNAGTQTITVVVRGLALGELGLGSARRVLFKEAAVGLFNGILIGLVATLIAYFLGAKPVVGLLLFLAMIFNLMIAGLSGAMIPLLLRWLKVDPAISSSIFVTACTDIGGFFVFLGLATIFISMGIL